MYNISDVLDNRAGRSGHAETGEIITSTHEEIMETYERDIAEKNRVVLSKQGIKAFLDSDLTIKDLFDFISEDDRALLGRIRAKDKDWRKDDKRLTKEEIVELLREIADAEY